MAELTHSSGLCSYGIMAMTFIVLAYVVMACIGMAYMDCLSVVAQLTHSSGRYGYDLCSDGLYSFGLCSYAFFGFWPSQHTVQVVLRTLHDVSMIYTHPGQVRDHNFMAGTAQRP